ncbi:MULTISPECIES: hypothetical protein [Clostridium]|uniref:Accessory Sec system protein Asp2 n=1 Tax=Clostridium disporicum TaxID=84024 RepID=A0A174GH85_9CLOT|nr:MULTISPECIES: hypothetical protein [Clostridium]MCD2500248.1 hypothetical protein [Clostridium sp. NSJ-145]CUO59825.1 accessory Sec system protein Asp2 [Clostridium disporicum]
MSLLIKVEKAVDLLKTKCLMKFKQRIYSGKKYNIKYLFEEKKGSKDLLIGFTACTKVGQKARYNYIKTLEEFKCNKLFILDDFGFDERGAYYLGKDRDFAIEKDVESLINDICKKIEPKKEFYIGSSKGGYAALYFGVRRKDTYIVVGAPQYNLGNYLNLPGHTEILKYIMGNCNQESISILNELLKEALIKNKENKNKIFLHYSDKEETFESDLKPLIDELINLNYESEFDLEHYESHAELTKYYPQYIKKILSKNLSR